MYIYIYLYIYIKCTEEHMQPLVFEYFSSNDHSGFLEDCSITLIDKTDGSDPTRREEYWRTVLKTITPYEVWWSWIQIQLRPNIFGYF